MQQIPHIGKNDSKETCFCLKGIKDKARRDACKNFQIVRQVKCCRVLLPKQLIPLKIEIIL